MSIFPGEPPPYSLFPTPDGFMICGPHAQSAQENRGEGTVSSVYVIQNRSFACVVDTGRFDRIYDVLRAALKKSNAQVEYIVLTHDHYDHVGNAERLQKEFGGRILAHSLDRPLLECPLLPYCDEDMRRAYGHSLQEARQDLGQGTAEIQAQFQTAKNFFSVPVTADRYLTGEESLDLHGLEIRLLHTPGHSPGSISVYVPRSRSLYTGDLTFWVNPCRPYPIGNAAHCMQSLQRLYDMAPTYCGPGHYRGIPDPQAWLGGLLENHRRLREAILLQLKTPRSLQELRAALFPQDPPDSFSPIPENSLQAHLVDLCQKGLIRRFADNGKIVWEQSKQGAD